MRGEKFLHLGHQQRESNQVYKSDVDNLSC